MEVAVFLSSILVLYFVFLLFVFIRTFCVFVYIFFAVRMLLLCIRLKNKTPKKLSEKKCGQIPGFVFSVPTPFVIIAHQCSLNWTFFNQCGQTVIGFTITVCPQTSHLSFS